MNFKELDYFDVLKLDKKKATFCVENGKGWIECEGQRYELNISSMLQAEISAKNPPTTYEGFKDHSAPLPCEDRRKVGIMSLMNCNDKAWILLLAIPPDNIMLLRQESFEKTIGTL